MIINNIVVLEEVSFDLKIGENFYNKQSLGLGDYFRDSIMSDIESLWLYGGVHKKQFGLYRLLSKRFPYGIYYDLKEGIITIVAILDMRINPKNMAAYLYYKNLKDD